MANTKMLKTIRRILSDLKENDELAIEGIQLYLKDKQDNKDDDDLYTFHCDIDIKHGIYAGIRIHTILRIPPKYPYEAPAMNIAPHFPFTSQHHGHVHGSSICNDMLSNFESYFKLIDSARPQAQVASGWSSGYTLNVILSQMQIFFADPDLPESRLPSDQAIERLRKSALEFKCKECSQKRTYRNLIGANNNSEIEDKEKKELDELKKRLICGITKLDFSTNDIILGYPLLMEIDQFNRLWPKIVLEQLSYEAYVQQIQMNGIAKLDNFSAIKLYSANGQLFNYWIPFYINEDHFKRAFAHITNAISVIRYGIKGVAQNDFRPDMVFEVLPCLMNKTIVHIMEGTVFHSTAAIQAYCSFLRLYIRLIKMYNLKPTINKRIARFIESPSERHKKQCGDLGEFIINMFLSDYSYFKHDKLRNALLTEFFTRQIYWIEKKSGRVLEHVPTVDERLRVAFDSSRVSNHLLVFNIEMAKFFIDDCDTKMKTVDERLGFLPERIISAFQERIVQIKSIASHAVLMQAIGFANNINSAQKMSDFLLSCKQNSKQQGYTR